jgi:hypothetical protein
VRSRCLICKHLVQAVQPVVFPPSKKELPFWEHPTLIRETQHLTILAAPKYPPNTDHQAADIDAENSDHDNNEEDEGEDKMVDTMTGTSVDDSGTFQEHFEGAIATMREFYKGLECQMQFGGSAGYIEMRMCIVFAVGQRVSWDEFYEVQHRQHGRRKRCSSERGLV